MGLLLPKSVLRAMEYKESKKRDLGKKFSQDMLIDVLNKYFTKMPDIEELWLLVMAKRDFISGKINLAFKACDKANKHIIDKPIQGTQLWYANQKTGELKPLRILPLSLPKQQDDLERVSGGSEIIKKSFSDAGKDLGYDLLTGKKVKQ